MDYNYTNYNVETNSLINRKSLQMQIILTHEQADFDAIASLLGAHHLNEKAIPVLPRRMNRNVRAFLTLYGAELPFVDPRDLSGEMVKSITLVDTQSLISVKGVSEDVNVHVIDHHPLRDDLPPGWVITVANTGANTTLFVETLRERDRVLSMVHATLLLLGIYEDTGSLTYDRTTARDLRAASFLLEQGASLQIAADFLNHPLSARQQELYERLKDSSETHDIHGNTIVIAYGDTQGMDEELSSIAHKLRDLFDPDALFLLVATRSGVQLIARSLNDSIDVGEIAAIFGGGGHERAAASLIKEGDLDGSMATLKKILPGMVRPAITVAQIMSREPQILSIDTPVSEALLRMQRFGYEGFPVVKDGKLVGLLTRRAVDRAMAHKLNLTAQSLMEAGDHTVLSDDSIERLQKLMTETGWGQVPVVDSDSGEIIGIVTRTDLLNTLTPQPKIPSRRNLAERLEKVLPPGQLALLKETASVAYDQQAALYIVGGFVRDLLLDRPSLDFDLVVEGDAINLARSLARKNGGRVTSHARFGTAKWHLPENWLMKLDAADKPASNTIGADSFHSLDLISARTEFYTYPTALPTVQRGSIKLDLHRRDFTINTLALRLDGNHYGELHDYWGGLTDLRQGLVRVLHSLSFVDDPTRILRAVRFEQRFNFSIEERTLQLMNEAVSLLDRVSGDRIRHELDHILIEERVAQIIERLDQLNLLKAIHPELVWDAWLNAKVGSIVILEPEQHWDFKDAKGLSWRRDLIYILWLLRLPFGHAQSVISRLRFSATLTEKILAARTLWTNLDRLADTSPSGAVGMLADVRPLALYATYHASDSPEIRRVIERFITQWRFVSPSIDGHNLQRRGIPPGPIYRTILNKLRDGWLDGEIQNVDQENKLIEKILQEFSQTTKK